MKCSDLFEKFKNRECKAKDIFELREISKPLAYDFISQYHYLGDAKFFSMYSYGMYCKQTNELCGCATYSLPQGKETAYGWFGIDDINNDIVELSRLCVLPELNGTNASSYLLGNSIKLLKSKNVRAIITLAEATRHVGSIYQVCNFKYFGLTDKKCDFYTPDGIFGRGKPSEFDGVWLPRSSKHRYAYIIDKSLKCKYKEQEIPKSGDLLINTCCNDKYVVEDKRNHKYYTCPKCTKKMIELSNDKFNEFFNSTLSNEELLNSINNYISENFVFENFEKLELF